MEQAPAPHDRLAGQRILITGGSGFIGSRLVGRLCREGAEVHAVSRTPRPAETTGPQWWPSDLLDLAAVRTLLATARPHVIYHLASRVTGSRDLDLVLPTFQNNLFTTVNLLIAAAETGCRRVVLAGSSEEPDEPGAVPCSPYAAAKQASSAYARMFQALYRVPVVVARIFMTYGPGQRDLTKLIPYVIVSLLCGEAARLTSGRRQVDWVYVDDVVDGLVAMARAPAVEGRTIDLGSGTLVPIRAVVEQLVTLVDAPREPLFGALPERPLERARVADTASTYARLGWKPTTPLADGLARTVDWYRRRPTRKPFAPAEVMVP